MGTREDMMVSGKIMRRFGWFFVVFFGLSFINDWLMMKEIGMIPIIYFLSSYQVDPTAEFGENAAVIITHAVLMVGTLYLLLRKKKVQVVDLRPR
jgi:hypothetical protein